MSLATLSPQALWAGEGATGPAGAEFDLIWTYAGDSCRAASRGRFADDAAGGDRPGRSVCGGRLGDVAVADPDPRGPTALDDRLLRRPTLSLQQVDLALRHRLGLGRRHHELVVAATPPREFGQRLRLDMDVHQPLWAHPD